MVHDFGDVGGFELAQFLAMLLLIAAFLLIYLFSFILLWSVWIFNQNNCNQSQCTQCASQSPCCFFDKITCSFHSTQLTWCTKTRRDSSTFRVLNQYYKD